jgi:hypothetical protein
VGKSSQDNNLLNITTWVKRGYTHTDISFQSYLLLNHFLSNLAVGHQFYPNFESNFMQLKRSIVMQASDSSFPPNLGIQAKMGDLNSFRTLDAHY